MIKTPKSLVPAMTRYQDGMGRLPDGFIALHDIYAEVDIKEQQATGAFILLEDHGLLSDGAMDRMKVRQITVAQKTDKTWEIHYLKWHSSGCWFKRVSGWARHLEMAATTPAKAENIVKNYEWTE